MSQRMEPRRKCFTCGTASLLLRFPERFEVGQREKLDVHFVSLKKIGHATKNTTTVLKHHPTLQTIARWHSALQVERGKPGTEVSKKEFADKTCVRRPTSAMPKPSFCVHQPSAVPFHGGVLVAAGGVSVVCHSGDIMCCNAVCDVMWWFWWNMIFIYSYTSIAARGSGGSFKRLKIYNSEEHVPIEFVCVTCFNTSHFEEPIFSTCADRKTAKKEFNRSMQCECLSLLISQSLSHCVSVMGMPKMFKWKMSVEAGRKDIRQL